MLTEQARMEIIQTLIRIIHHFSDKEYQKRIWIEERGPECDSYDDAVCIFYDMGDPVMDNPSEYKLTDPQVNIFKIFREELEEFSDENHWPPFFIDSPEWDQIIRRAKEVLEVFNYEKK